MLSFSFLYLIFQIDLAVSLVTLLSAEGGHNPLILPTYIPDNSDRLARSTDLVNDDVPWLVGPAFIQIRAGCRFVHPNVSSHVAQKLGVQSLRLTLIKQNLEQNLFDQTNTTNNGFSGYSQNNISESLIGSSSRIVGDGTKNTTPSVTAFGQAESLTSRLKSILDLYPEGNPIFSELIQNADDAGASIVRFMLDENSYGVESLLDTSMAPLQGPALLVCNDAVFTEDDFRSLARIGQGSKLEKLASTGRFGLGFSSTYHLTDAPSFVSGDHLVVFDPHCYFAPGANFSQPGVRIRFKGSGLPTSFPDQFIPFQFFGCDFKDSYPGALFRLPLRTRALARRSEISKQSYTIESMMENLSSFASQLPQHLLFLRSVRSIEIYKCSYGESIPVLLHKAVATISKVEVENDLSLLQFFEKKSSFQSTVSPSRDVFYQKLKNTPDDKLPVYSQLVGIVTSNFTHTLPILTSVEVIDGMVSPKSAESIEPTVLDNLNDSSKEEVVYLVVGGLMGGEAKRMAADEATRHLKLVPMGAVAACVARRGDLTSCSVTRRGVVGEQPLSRLFPDLAGQAFCFLPLPVSTQLPVHVNAYWELSSNRRDIWR